MAIKKLLGWYNNPKIINDNFEDVQEQIDAIEASQIEPAATIAAIPASTNITAVPAEFEDVAAVRTYLAGSGVVPNLESRLDNLELKINTLIANLKASGAIEA